jgi:hypothetical protein
MIVSVWLTTLLFTNQQIIIFRMKFFLLGKKKLKLKILQMVFFFLNGPK